MNNRKMDRRLGVLVALTFLCLMAVPLLEQLPQNAVRLHVIANSDSAADQAVKLAVRDAVLSAMNPHLANVNGKAEARELLLQNAPALQKAAENALIQGGAPYAATLYYGQAAFPDRLYGERFYPAGDYETLRVVLGEGAGKNWWCVMFPPLCLVDFEQAQTPASGEGEKVVFESAVAKLFSE